MNYSTLPFTLVAPDETYLLDVGALYTQAQTLVDHRKARGRQYPLALIVTVAVLAKLAGYTHVEDIADWAKLRCQELHVLFASSGHACRITRPGAVSSVAQSISQP
ncbi:MAG: transposase family protein [Kouleothrix sp.]|nr:transposase family protein [Kouleothrix sp.]